MPKSFHHSLHFEYSLFPPQLRSLFFGHLFRGGAQQLAGLFIPIFLFLKGSDLQFPLLNGILSPMPWLLRGIIVVSLYFFVFRLLVFLLSIPLARFIGRIRLMNGMIVGNIFLIATFGALLLSSDYPSLLLLAPLFSAIETVCYWIPYYTQFALRADFKKMGQEIGAIQFLDRLVRAALPMIGGMIVGVAGFRMLYAIGVVLILASSVFFLCVRDSSMQFSVSLKEFFVWLSKPELRRVIIGFAGKYLDDSAFALWSVYIFLFLGSVERVGFVYTLVLFASLFLSYFMGWYLGKHRARHIFFLAGGALSLVWFMRSFVQSIWHVIAVDLADRLAVCVYNPIFDLNFFLFSRGKKVFQFYVFREMTISVIGMAFWLLIIAIFVLPIHWIGVFILGGVGVLLSLNMSEERA